jgi:hypothetical protein
MDLENAKSDVYTEKSGTYYVKISIRDIGLYISGITVKKSPKYGDWWVQMPYYKDYKTGKTKRYIEFDQESPVRLAIEKLSIEAVEATVGTNATNYKDITPTDDDLSKPPNLSHIPFN